MAINSFDLSRKIVDEIISNALQKVEKVEVQRTKSMNAIKFVKDTAKSPAPATKNSFLKLLEFLQKDYEEDQEMLNTIKNLETTIKKTKDF